MNERLDILSRRKSIKLFIDQLEGVLQLPAEDVKSYIEAMITYATTETLPEGTTQLARAFFTANRSNMQRANDAYVKRTISNRANLDKRGKKPDELAMEPSNGETLFDEFSPMEETCFSYTDTETDTDTVTETVTDTEEDTDRESTGLAPCAQTERAKGSSSSSEYNDCFRQKGKGIEAAAINIPLVGGGQAGVSEAQLDSFVGDYPGIDVRHSLEKYARWLGDNPHRRPVVGALNDKLRTWLRYERPQSSPSPTGAVVADHMQHVYAEGALDYLFDEL